MKLSQILEALGGGFADGDGYVCLCPAHEDTKPSLRVALSDAGKVLLACRAGCSFNEVLLAAQGLGANDLFDVEDDMDGETVSAEDAEIAPDVYDKLEQYVRHRQSYGWPAGMAYAAERFGVSKELYKEWQLGYEDGEDVDAFTDLFGNVYFEATRLVVPFRDMEGEIWGLQSRAIDGKTKAKWAGPHNPKTGGTWAKTAFFSAGTGVNWLVVTEGPGDAMTAAAAGGIDAVGIRGASMATAVADEIAEMAEGRTVFIAGDRDQAGQKFNKTLVRSLSLRNVQAAYVELPEHANDLSEWYANSKEGFATEFQDALSAAEGFAETKENAKVKPVSSYIPTTDVGLADYILDKSDNTVAHSPSLGFMIYKDGVWQRDETKQTRKLIHSAARDLHKQADKALDADTAALITASANRLLTTREIDKFLIEMEALSAVDMEEFNQNDHLLVVKNGVVNLQTGELTDHDPDLLATQRVRFDYMPEAECPRWEAFLEEIFPEAPEEMAQFMQRLIGYGITGETKEQCFGILHGLGANGKSVTTNTLGYVFEELTKVTPFSTFEAKAGGIPNDLAALHSARIVLAAEGERGKAMSEATIKRATGSDKIPARFLRQEFFEFQPKFLLLLATNHKPNFKSADAGLWRRVKMIPFSRFFKPHERDSYLEYDLRTEAEGILAWAVQGAIDWYEHGLEDPALVREATSTYRDNADALSEFIGSAVLPRHGHDEAAADVYKAYRTWAFNNDLQPKDTWSRTAFYQSMDERGYRRTRKGTATVFEHLEIAPEIRKDIM